MNAWMDDAERATLTPEEAELRIAIRKPKSERTPREIELRAAWLRELKARAPGIAIALGEQK